MTAPAQFEDVVVCFCGHGLFDHEEYGPCSAKMHAESDRPCNCQSWNGCLVIGAAGDGGNSAT